MSKVGEKAWTGTTTLPQAKVRRRTSSRRRTLLALLATAVLASVLAWGLATRIKSPVQAAAEAAPPSPSLITVDARMRRLTREVTARGEVVVSRTTEVMVGEVSGADRMVVSARPARRGDLISEGDVAVEVSGRPVFVLEGKVPSYRPLERGSHGADVQQLQEALARLGYGVSANGVFGTKTDRALRSMYARAGYGPISSGGDRRGVQLPVDEVAFVPDLPGTVVDTGPGLGRIVEEKPLVTIADGSARIEVKVPVEDADVLQVGQSAAVDIEGVDGSVRAKVASIGKSSADDGDSGPAQAEVTLESLEYLDPELSGKAVVAEMTIVVTDGPVLTVPLTAVWTSPGGQEQVTLIEGVERKDVSVRPGASGDGYIEVTPIDSTQLRAGSHVLVE